MRPETTLISTNHFTKIGPLKVSNWVQARNKIHHLTENAGTRNSYADLHGLPFVYPDLPSLSNHGCDSWMNDLALDLCHSHMPEIAVMEHAPLDVMNPHEFGFDKHSIPQSHYEDIVGHLSCTTERMTQSLQRSDSTYTCQWRVDRSPCNAFIALGDNLKHSISQHLSKVHSLLPAGGKLTQKCQWAGCAKELKQESIVRHILTVHLRVTTECEACGTSFARRDSLQRHIKKSCGSFKEKR